MNSNLLAHSLRVSELAVNFSKILVDNGYDIDFQFMSMAGFCHDIGKIELDQAVLNKPSKLTPEEFNHIKQHSIFGEKILENLSYRNIDTGYLSKVVRHHHENFDGSGYPDNLLGELIPLESRILRLVDVFDALLSQRAYKNAFSRGEAIKTMEKEKNFFDSDLFEIFKKFLV